MATYTKLQDIINYHFTKPELLEEATLAAGASVFPNIHGDVKGNKPLALIGDALIHLDVATTSYASGIGTGESTNFLSVVGSNESPEALGRQLDVDRCVTKNPCQQGEVPKITLASTVEAIIGAVWVDSGHNFGQVQAVLRTLGVAGPLTTHM